MIYSTTRRLLDATDNMSLARVEEHLDRAPSPFHARCIEFLIMYKGGLLDRQSAAVVIQGHLRSAK